MPAPLIRPPRPGDRVRDRDGREGVVTGRRARNEALAWVALDNGRCLPLLVSELAAIVEVPAPEEAPPPRPKRRPPVPGRRPGRPNGPIAQSLRYRAAILDTIAGRAAAGAPRPTLRELGEVAGIGESSACRHVRALLDEGRLHRVRMGTARVLVVAKGGRS